MMKHLKNQNGLSLAEVMVSVGLVGILAVVNLNMYTQNMRAQKTAAEQAAASRTFQSIIAILANPTACSAFLADENPDFAQGETLPAPFRINPSDTPRRIDNDRVLRAPSSAIILFQTHGSTIAAEPKIYENMLIIDGFYLKTYRDSAGGQATTVLGVTFKPSSSTYSATSNIYPFEGVLNITVNTNRIDSCFAAAGR